MVSPLYQVFERVDKIVVIFMLIGAAEAHTFPV